VQKGVLTGEEALRYAMSLPVTTTITGIDKPEALQQALKVAQGFEPLQPAAMQALRDRCRQYAADGRFELTNCRSSSTTPRPASLMDSLSTCSRSRCERCSG
jgi:predicted aldo/keto reductase-like oxidoreductase